MLKSKVTHLLVLILTGQTDSIMSIIQPPFSKVCKHQPTLASEAAGQNRPSKVVAAKMSVLKWERVHLILRFNCKRKIFVI